MDRHIVMNRLLQFVHESLVPLDTVHPIVRRVAALILLLVPGALVVSLCCLLVLRLGAVLGVSRQRIRESDSAPSA
ncbi:MAG TPA: hypothetical protein VF104_10795 [Burkholderiales bacterium]